MFKRRKISKTYGVEVSQRSVFAGLGDGLHGIDVGADVLQGQLPADDVLNLIRTRKQNYK
jgi:hypothetical protein